MYLSKMLGCLLGRQVGGRYLKLGIESEGTVFEEQLLSFEEGTAQEAEQRAENMKFQLLCLCVPVCCVREFTLTAM